MVMNRIAVLIAAMMIRLRLRTTLENMYIVLHRGFPFGVALHVLSYRVPKNFILSTSYSQRLTNL
jgi:hypothetical protein